MATVVDALLVTLGLDPSDFVKGQKQATESLKKTGDEADRAAKEMEAKGKQAAQFFAQIKKEVVGLFAVFTAGKGIEAFVSDVVAGDAAVGRLATNIGMTTESLSAWEGVADRAGGSAQGIAASLQNMAQQAQNFQLRGEASQATIEALARMHIDPGKFLGGSTSQTERMMDLADAFSHLSAPAAQMWGKQLGLDEGTINVLMQGRQAVQALLAEQEKIGATNAADARSAQQLQNAWKSLTQSSTDLGRKVLTELSPYLVRLSDALLKLSEWAASHRPMVEAMFVGLAAAVTAFAVVLAAPVAGMAALSAGIGIAVSAIAILYDDWKTWIDGGQSAFAGFWQFFADKWAEVSGVVMPAFESMKAVFADWVETAKALLGLVVALFTGNAADIRSAWSTLVNDLGKYFTDWVGLIRNLGPAILAAFKVAFTSAFNWVKSRAKTIWNAITGKDDPDASASSPATASSPAPAAGRSVLAEAMAAAKASQDKYGIPASVTLAQFALESGNGAHMPAGSNNPFGIKAKPGQAYVEAQTNEFINGKMQRVTQRFAKFDSLADAFDAHAKLLATASPYAAARAHADDPRAFANALTGTYATDPMYGAKLNAIMARNGAGGTSSSNTDVKINQITVQTAATDARGIARDMGAAMQNNFLVSQANTGLS
jgi:flagellum-specific peptidoglycan hydrolase FlgJ